MRVVAPPSLLKASIPSPSSIHKTKDITLSQNTFKHESDYSDEGNQSKFSDTINKSKKLNQIDNSSEKPLSIAEYLVLLEESPVKRHNSETISIGKLPDCNTKFRNYLNSSFYILIIMFYFVLN